MKNKDKFEIFKKKIDGIPKPSAKVAEGIIQKDGKSSILRNNKNSESSLKKFMKNEGKAKPNSVNDKNLFELFPPKHSKSKTLYKLPENINSINKSEIKKTTLESTTLATEKSNLNTDQTITSNINETFVSNEGSYSIKQNLKRTSLNVKKKSQLKSNSIVKDSLKIQNIESEIKSGPLMIVELIENMRNLLILCGKDPNKLDNVNNNLYQDFRIPSGKSKHNKCLSTDLDKFNILKKINPTQAEENKYILKFQMIFRDIESLHTKSKELVQIYKSNEKSSMILKDNIIFNSTSQNIEYIAISSDRKEKIYKGLLEKCFDSMKDIGSLMVSTLKKQNDNLLNSEAEKFNEFLINPFKFVKTQVSDSLNDSDSEILNKIENLERDSKRISFINNIEEINSNKGKFEIVEPIQGKNEKIFTNSTLTEKLERLKKSNKFKESLKNDEKINSDKKKNLLSSSDLDNDSVFSENVTVNAANRNDVKNNQESKKITEIDQNEEENSCSIDDSETIIDYDELMKKNFENSKGEVSDKSVNDTVLDTNNSFLKNNRRLKSNLFSSLIVKPTNDINNEFLIENGVKKPIANENPKNQGKEIIESNEKTKEKGNELNNKNCLIF